MRKKSNRLPEQFDQTLIEESFAALVNEHRKIVHTYEEQIANYEKIVLAQEQALDYQDRIIANYLEMFEVLKQQFPETRVLLDNIEEVPQR